MVEQRRARDSVATRAALLAAAQDLFTRDGYQGVGVREIAQRAGVDKALIVRYFGSKERLFAEAIPATFGIQSLVSGPRSEFGRRLAAHIVFHTDQAGFDPMMAMFRSLADERAATHLADGMDERIIRPLALWLGGGVENERRAIILVGQLLGLSITFNLLKSSATKDAGAAEMYERLAAVFQLTLDAVLESPVVDLRPQVD